jgi:hypothetical protein
MSTAGWVKAHCSASGSAMPSTSTTTASGLAVRTAALVPVPCVSPGSLKIGVALSSKLMPMTLVPSNQ